MAVNRGTSTSDACTEAHVGPDKITAHVEIEKVSSYHLQQASHKQRCCCCCHPCCCRLAFKLAVEDAMIASAHVEVCTCQQCLMVRVI